MTLLQKIKNKQMKNKQKELNEHPGSGSDPPIGSNRKGVLQQLIKRVIPIKSIQFLYPNHYLILQTIIKKKNSFLEGALPSITGSQMTMTS